MLLVEEGFTVTSIDMSEKMLKYALQERWNRRKEDAFDKWGGFILISLSNPLQGISITRSTFIYILEIGAVRVLPSGLRSPAARGVGAGRSLEYFCGAVRVRAYNITVINLGGCLPYNYKLCVYI